MKWLLALLALLKLAAYLVWGMPPLPGEVSATVQVADTQQTPQLQLLAE